MPSRFVLMADSCPDDFESVVSITGPAGTIHGCVPLDTGADVTILSNSDATRLGIVPTHVEEVLTADGTSEMYFGTATIQVGVHPPGDYPVIWSAKGRLTVLGKDVVQALGLLIPQS